MGFGGAKVRCHERRSAACERVAEGEEEDGERGGGRGKVTCRHCANAMRVRSFRRGKFFICHTGSL